MATLKGQNLRILLFVGNKYSVVAKSTNCQITLSSNTEEANTKDDLSMAAKPEITSKSWSVSVDSLDVTDYERILNGIRNMLPFTLQWDETSTTDNQTEMQEGYARTGQAYMNDVTFTWDDRSPSTKTVQFTGLGPISDVSGTHQIQSVAVDGNYTKGQFVRLFLGNDNTATPSKVIAAAKQLSLHISLTLEDTTTKDTQGNWQSQEPTGLSYDITSSALVRSGDVITSAIEANGLTEVEAIYESSTPVKFFIAFASGANQRTKGNTIISGSVIITQLQIAAPNRGNATYNTTLNGYGIYDVGEPNQVSNSNNEDDEQDPDDNPIPGLE